MMLIALRYGLGLATLLFILAYISIKKKKQPLHQVLALTGVIITVVVGLALIIMVQMVSDGDSSRVGIIAAEWALPYYSLAHRALATIAFLLMLYMAVSGLMKKTRYHKKIGPIFLAIYLIVYFSGLVIFQEAVFY